jgi:hypothetical protein
MDYASVGVTVYPVPTGETTSSNGWGDGPDDTIHRWLQTLLPSLGGNFAGRTVTERDPGGGGPDTCWFPQSNYLKAEAITGGSWSVDANNTWGPDYVGWHYDAVVYYRNQGRAPCETSFPQAMQIDRPGGPSIIYVTNVLRAGITSISVWSERAGQYAERIWP